MSIIERYRLWYEHERFANEAMLVMLESVPEERRGEAMYQRALDYAMHLAVCRDNWLDRMVDGGEKQVPWFPEGTKLEQLRPRFTETERAWVTYLDSISDEDLERDFEFLGSDGVTRFRWNVEGQIVQLLGHAFYHRGMIAMIVDDLGGKKTDTDYLFWAYQRDPRWGQV